MTAPKALLAALLATLLALSLGLAASESDATAEYGGAGLSIEFQPNGGEGGYVQRVLPGNSFFFPTEADVSGPRDQWDAFRMDGHVLTGWRDAETGNVRYPGEISPATVRDSVYQAIWEPLEYQFSGRLTKTAEHDLVARGSAMPSKAYASQDDNTVALLLSLGEADRTTYSFSAYLNGRLLEMNSAQPDNIVIGSLSAGGFTVSTNRLGGGVTLSLGGTPASAGVYVLELKAENRLGEATAKWYVSSHDPVRDASNILRLDYSGADGTEVYMAGPYGTAVVLPAKEERYQYGWSIVVNGAAGVFPPGSPFTLVVSGSISPASFTFAEVAASGVVGVLAYNANGGEYIKSDRIEGRIAELVPTSGYAGLASGEMVRKEGCVFLGWNSSGSPQDPIMASGFPMETLPEMFDSFHYAELRAVWAPVAPAPAPRSIVLEDPDDPGASRTLSAFAGYMYALPSVGFDRDRLTFAGWSSERHDAGSGEADVESPMLVEESVTLYPVYRPIYYTFIITFDKSDDRATGQMEDVIVSFSSLEAPAEARLPACGYSLAGHAFAGWTASKGSADVAYSDASVYRCDGDGTATLYALWRAQETPAPETRAVTVVYVANGPASNMPSSQTFESVTAEVSVTVSRTAPTRAGAEFHGWSRSQDPSPGEPLIAPGAALTEALGATERSRTVYLYAQWEAVSEDDRAVVTYQFNGRAETRLVAIGEPAPYISPSLEPGFSFLGWLLDGEPYDINSPVTGDLVLKARIAQVFSSSVDGRTVRVTIALSPLPDSVSASFNGQTRTYAAGEAIVYEGAWESSVRIVVSAGDGIVASETVRIGAEPAAEEEEEDGKDLTLYYIAAAIAIVALIAVGRIWL